MTIKDLAWNEAYGEGIKAGEGAPWIGEQEIELPSNLKLQQLADYLQISSAEKQGKLSFYNLQGAQIEKGEQRLKLDFLPKGILIAHLEDGSEEKQIKVLIY